MSTVSGFINCPELQVQLNMLFANVEPETVTEPLVFTGFLLSDANLSGSRQMQLKDMVSPGGGKKRRVQVVYSPRIPEASVKSNTGDTNCVADPVVGEVDEIYEIGEDYEQIDWQIDPRDLSERCEDNTVFVARKLAQYMNVMDRRMESIYVNTLPSINGKYAVGVPNVTSDILQVQTRNADGNYSSSAFVDPKTAATYSAYATPPVILGGMQWGKYVRETNAGCCSAEGLDWAALAAQYGFAFLETYRADDAMGQGGAMMMAGGAVQLLEYMEYEGLSNLDMGVLRQMVIMSPITGQRYDLKIYIDCNGVFNFFLRKHYRLVTLPNDVFYPGDRLYGVNFVNELQIVNP